MIIGIVAKPNTGKSTFFKAATLAEVEIANYPFTTIEKNEGISFVKVDCVDKDFNVKCNPNYGYCVNNKRFIPFQLIDVAGLVPDAHKGKGRGNQFLDDLRQADVLIHIVDVAGTTNEKGEPVEVGSYDPLQDIKILENEIDMWFLSIIKKGWDKFAKQIKQENLEVDKALAKQLSGLKINEDIVNEVINKLNLGDVNKWNEEDLRKLAIELRKRTKPIIVAANKIDIDKGNFERIKNEYKEHIIIACSAESELALKEANKNNLIKYVPGENNFEIIGSLNEKQEKALEFIKKNVLDKYKSTGVQEVLNEAVFDLLNYIVVYPVATSKLTDKDGNYIPDALLVPKGTTTLELAYKIHSDIGDNFVKAVNLKTKQVIGKDSELENNDVVEIMTKK